MFETNYANTYVEPQNKVLKNTYLLLALSMLPTMAGTWLGISTGLMHLFTGWVGLALFLAGSMGLMYLIEKNKNNAAGVPILLGFTFFMGIMLSSLVGSVLRLKNGGELVMFAFGGTAVIFAAMASLATVVKRDLSSMYKFAFVGFILIFIASIANMFLHSSTLMILVSTLAIGIFSAFLLYDVQRIINGGETNYITATLSIYLNLFNLFQNLLALLGIFGGSDD